LIAYSAAAAPRPHFDLSFEQPECTNQWFEDGSFQSPYEELVVASGAQSGQQSVRIRYTSDALWTPAAGYGGMYQILPVDGMAGKRLRLSGFIRTEGITTGYTGYWVLIYGETGIPTFVEMSSQGVSGTLPWTRYSLEADVPAGASLAVIGFELPGNGTAWFDNITLEADGQPLKEGPPPVLPVPSPGHVNWVRQNAIPVATVEAGHGFADLQPLRQVIGDARIVALGEASHGTKEFFQMKHRLLEFLVTEMGFTHFSIEANMPEAYRINEYVLTGQGDPEELVEGMGFWTWNTQELLDMVLWMRAYNASGQGPVQFTGFDAQVAAGAADNLRGFLADADPSYLPAAESAFARVATAEQTRLATAADVAAARAVLDHMSSRRNDYLANFSVEKVEWMIQNARIVVQVIELIARRAPRDLSMAENVNWILDHAPAGSKIVLWAHNGHVNRVPQWMGGYLDERHGDDMYVLSLNFGNGRYNARGPEGLTSHPVHPPVPGSLETLFQATGMPRFILDLRHMDEEAPDLWFRKPRLLQSHGAAHYHCAFYPTVVTSDYDGMVWIDPTNPSTLLSFD
jgi:erythromycin esterase